MVSGEDGHSVLMSVMLSVHLIPSSSVFQSATKKWLKISIQITDMFSHMNYKQGLSILSISITISTIFWKMALS